MICASTSENYKYDPQCCYDFSPYARDLSGIELHYGLGRHNLCRTTGVTYIKFVVEHPNSIHLTLDRVDLNLNDENTKYDFILNICPYSCNYLNERFSTTKYTPIFFPLPPCEYNPSVKRDIPAFYSGHGIHIPEISYILDVVRKYTGVIRFSELCRSISTPHKNSFYDKMRLYNRTKICICHNVLNARLIPNIESVRSDPLYQKHFPWVKERRIMAPQIKSRMFEGAMMGCILLVFKDEYGMTDRYFTEGEEFLYFTDKEDLKKKIELILNNYDKYKYLSTNAQKRFFENYTFEHFVTKLVTLN